MTNLTRERNFDLIRSILLAIESSPPDSTITNSQLSIEGHDPSVVALHVEMLKNAGFIDAVIEKNFSGSAFMIKGINWEGYEFLDNAKNDTIWKKFKAQAFFVPKKEIKENGYDLSINRYKEIEYEEVEYEPPKVILGKLRSLEAEISSDLDELEKMLG